LAAVLVPVAVTALAAALTVAAGGAPSVGPGLPGWAQVAATFLSTVLLVGLFEEVGWRGYALPRLQQRMSGLRAALLLGVIWAAWHLPELVSDPTGQRPVIQFLVLVVAQSVFLSWLYNGSAAGLPLVIISHATVDTAARIALPPFAASSSQLVWWSLAGLWAATAVVVAVRGRWSVAPVREVRGADGAATRRAGDAGGSA
jgi:membrane protease YdiL (CAAX protease family)